MRDIVLTLIIAGILPFTLKKPYYGLLLWIWVGIMVAPADLRFCVQPAVRSNQRDFFLSRHSAKYKRLVSLPLEWRYRVDAGTILWLGISPLFSFHPEFELDEWLRVFKIQLMVLLGFLVVETAIS